VTILALAFAFPPGEIGWVSRVGYELLDRKTGGRRGVSGAWAKTSKAAENAKISKIAAENLLIINFSTTD